MRSEKQDAKADNTQRIYARLAGSLLLLEIIIVLGSGFILSRIAGNGTFAETAKRITASEHLYRTALSAVVIATLSSVLLAFALYATLKPVNSLLAQLAMIFWLADSFLGLLVRMSSFVRVHLYISEQIAGAGTIATQTLTDLMRSVVGTTENIGGICFGIASLLFFYLFFKTRYIPKLISVLGVFASAIWTGLYFANLIFPEQQALFQKICPPPMALADVITGFYLMLFAVKTGGSGNLTAQRLTMHSGSA